MGMRIFDYNRDFISDVMTDGDFLTGIETVSGSPRCGERFWFCKTIDILTLVMSIEINQWMANNNINYPFDKENTMFFELTWG